MGAIGQEFLSKQTNDALSQVELDSKGVILHSIRVRSFVRWFISSQHKVAFVAQRYTGRQTLSLLTGV